MFSFYGVHCGAALISAMKSCFAFSTLARDSFSCHFLHFSLVAHPLDASTPQVQFISKKKKRSRVSQVTHCQTAPTYNGRCACLDDSLAKLGRLQQMEAHPNITAMLVTLFEDRKCLAVRSIFVKLRRVFFVGHGERLRVGHEEGSNGATSSQQWQSSSASVRGHETEIHALLRTNDDSQTARTLYAKWALRGNKQAPRSRASTLASKTLPAWITLRRRLFTSFLSAVRQDSLPSCLRRC